MRKHKTPEVRAIELYALAYDCSHEIAALTIAWQKKLRHYGWIRLGKIVLGLENQLAKANKKGKR